MISLDLPKRIHLEIINEIHSVEEHEHDDAQVEHQAMKISSQDLDEVLDRQEDSSSISETSSVDEPHADDRKGTIRTIKMKKKNISNISM